MANTISSINFAATQNNGIGRNYGKMPLNSDNNEPKDTVSFSSNPDKNSGKSKKIAKTAMILGGALALAGAIFALTKGKFKGKSKVIPEKPVSSPDKKMPEGIAKILKDAGIENDKLIKVLEKEGIGLKIEDISRIEDYQAFIKNLRDSGKYGDKIKKICILSPEKTRTVLETEGIDVTNLPQNTYLRTALDADEKGLYTELVLAKDFSTGFKINTVRQFNVYDGSCVLDV